MSKRNIRNNKGLIFAIATSFTMSSQMANAATLIDLRQYQSQLAKTNVNITLSELAKATDSEMQMMRENENDRGVTFRRYQQMYQGTKVWGKVVLEREDPDQNLSYIGTVATNIANDMSSMTPTIDAATAMEIVKSEQNNMLLAKNSVLEYRDESSEMVVYIDESETAQLAYEVSYFSDQVEGGQPERPFAIVDAHSGEILAKWEGLATAVNATGPGGNEKTGIYFYGQDFDPLTLDDNCRFINPAVRTINLNHGTTGTRPFEIDCNNPNNDFKAINGAYSPINDAHFFGNVIFDLYLDVMGIAPLQNQLVMRVHYSRNYENAFWDGRAMTFGDGANFMYPLVSLDVAAHEVSHGFTEQNSGLVYRNQSGGLNESFSDMAGEAAELFFKGSNDFLTGADIIKGNNQFLRSLENPPLDGRSIGKASDYRNGMDVHYSSGVYNRAYTLLSKKPGWDAIKSFKLFATANRFYWTPNSTFNSAACGALDAAADLGYNGADVFDALADVEVACPNRPRPGNEPPNPDTGTTVLENGVPVNGLTNARGSQSAFSIRVPQNARNLQLNISGGNGDADLYLRFAQAPTLSDYDQRPYRDGNNESITISEPQAGTYYVMLNGYADYSNVSLVATFEVVEAEGSVYKNTDNYSIPDAQSRGVISPLTVNRSGQTGLVRLSVDIPHSYRGDLVIRLISPNNSVYLIEDFVNNDSADNVNKSYLLDFSGLNVNSLGFWGLQVSDLARRDVGYINEWSLDFGANSVGGNAGDAPLVSESDPRLHEEAKENSAGGGLTGELNSSASGALGLLLLLAGFLRRRREASSI